MLTQDPELELLGPPARARCAPPIVLWLKGHLASFVMSETVPAIGRPIQHWMSMITIGARYRSRRGEPRVRRVSVRGHMPMRVVFLSPAYPPEMQQYTRGLAEVGAEIYGIGDSHPQALPPDVKKYLHAYLQVCRASWTRRT